MQPLQRTSIAVRPWLIVPALILAVAAAGCHHKRQSLRPVYVGPAVPVVAPSSDPCPGGEPCAGTAPSPAFGQPGDLGSPPPSSVAPGPVPRSGMPGPAEQEPRLLPNTPGASGEGAPVPNGPLGQRGSTNRRPAVGTSRRLDGRDKVSAFLDDPNELFLPPKADRPWKYIVVHHSDAPTGSYAQIDRDHRERLGTQGCGYHLVVGNGSESPDGRIEVARRWSDQKPGAHCRDATVPDANDYGIGICLIGDFDQKAPSDKQILATKALIDYLRDRYNIPADHVVTHASIAPTATRCPGKFFPAEILVDSRGFASR